MLRTFPRVAVLTVALAGVFTLSPWVLARQTQLADPSALLLAAANTLPLLAVRWNPLLVVAVFSVAYPLWVDAGHPTHILQSLPTFVAMYAVGTWERALWVRSLALLSPVWMVTAAVVGWWESVDPLELGLELGYVAVMFVVVWGLGVVVAERRTHAAEMEARTALLAERSTQLEEAQRALAERAVADERARIARELHDVIAHAMSVITVRAGVAAHLAGADSHRSGDGAPTTETIEALAVIERTGREALSEMRRMLAVLREPGGTGPPGEPQPGVADLPALIDRVTAAGTTVTHRIEGRPYPLPVGLDLAVYRVVQEALTNVAKHATGNRATVTIRYRGEGVEVEIGDHGGAPTHAVVPGQGLRGMAERVALYDGHLETGTTGDGFRVAARFPLERVP